MDEQKNMELWTAVSTTDKAHTKEVSYGKRKFTAIDAYHQILRATQVWGPVGMGWGWDAEFTIVGELCFATLRMWYGGDRANRFTSVGSAKVGNDGEAPKKALTDGITKGLSYLGFNADVFLGQFDSNKYVGPDNPQQSGQSHEPPRQQGQAQSIPSPF